MPRLAYDHDKVPTLFPLWPALDSRSSAAERVSGKIRVPLIDGRALTDPPAGLDGARHHQAKLTEEQVRAIRADHAAGVEGVALAQRYGVSQTCISRIVLRRSWRYVQ